MYHVSAQGIDERMINVHLLLLLLLPSLKLTNACAEPEKYNLMFI